MLVPRTGVLGHLEKLMGTKRGMGGYDEPVFSQRSLLSLSQYFALQELGRTELLFVKHGILGGTLRNRQLPEFERGTLIRKLLTEAQVEQIETMLSEVVRTQGSYRNQISPRYVYDERWRDITICLALDGYLIEYDQIRRTEPNLDGNVAVEDDLTRELQRSGLAQTGEILRLLNISTEHFRASPPDSNGALTNARTALQTIATDLSRGGAASRPPGFDERVWGQVISHLRTSGLITHEEEKGLAGVFTFVSPGAHGPVGLSELEMVRLGRSFIFGMCYFLVKRHNG